MCDHFYIFRSVRRRNRRIHKDTIQKGGTRRLNQSPKYMFGFQLYDKVHYKNEELFIMSRRKDGRITLKTIGGKMRYESVSYKKLKFLEPRKAIIVARYTRNKLYLKGDF
jgi:N6-L-threonylcarbamoyladenine synthase